MARGYAAIGTDGTVIAIRGIQGEAMDISSERFWCPALASATSGKAPGLYRLTATAEKGHARVHARLQLGAKVADASVEATRLRDNASRQAMHARTRSPGICGYLEAERASSARLANNWRESLAMADWLDLQAEWARPKAAPTTAPQGVPACPQTAESASTEQASKEAMVERKEALAVIDAALRGAGCSAREAADIISMAGLANAE